MRKLVKETAQTTLEDILNKKGNLDSVKGLYLKIIDGPFTQKQSEYKNKGCKFLFYDARNKMVGVELEDGKSVNLYPKELVIDTERHNVRESVKNNVRRTMNEVRRLQQLAGLMKENTQPSTENSFEKIIDISDEATRYFSYDIDELQDTANDRGFQSYSGGIKGYDGDESKDTGNDYQWAIAMGDDFPHAIIIKNKQMLEDPQVVDFLKRLKSKNW